MTFASRATSSPYLEWAKLCSRAPFNLATSGIAGYSLANLPVLASDLEINGPDGYGYQPLQERLAQKCGVTPDCIVTAAGTTMANHLAMAVLLSPGDDVLIERPTYGPILDVTSWLGANILRFDRRPEDGFQIDPDEVQRHVTPKTRLIVLTNLHNPTGAFTGEPTLAAIREIAAKAGAHVLIDEVYLDTVYDLPVRSSFHLGPEFVVTNSLTKAYGLSGLRCGWIIAEPALATRIWRLNDIFGATPVHPGDRLNVIALDHLAQIDARARQILQANRAALDGFFAARTDLAGFRSRWGTVTFPRLIRGSVDEFAALLRDRFETSVVPGSFFEIPDHFRIGIGGDPAMTAQALDRLAQALDEYGSH
ncbi:MAG TPA: pyridoxal phosphate-dependent aminotransferase [Candidatus Methylacidiphilales bacterium]|nr:pyridoxal phosphate-dependent aminotransferase [Candidatus Methylacidiphilales bacterium]